jgi:hypothetical protein
VTFRVWDVQVWWDFAKEEAMKKASAKKPARKKAVSKSRKPVDLQGVREAIANLVGTEAVEISGALVEEAKKGELAPAKFLFEMSGLYPLAAGASADDEDAQDAEDGAELAKVLLQRLHLPESSEEGEGSGAVRVTGADGNSVE